ncbi:hypothetical protein [Plantactinospora sonchi]|uniref:Uncharacterized protein n=1 Tax=Plantactinospora sonchi TaxID=1544735 RepID=A0ABU7RVL1_9ACTN
MPGVEPCWWTWVVLSTSLSCRGCGHPRIATSYARRNLSRACSLVNRPICCRLPDTISPGGLDRTRRTGEVAAALDVAAEAANLLALATGLADSVMAGLRDAEAAQRLLRHQLDRVFDTAPLAG